MKLSYKALYIKSIKFSGIKITDWIDLSMHVW